MPSRCVGYEGVYDTAPLTAAVSSSFFLELGDQHVGRQRQAADAGGVQQRGLGDLGRVDDADLEHVAVLAGGGVVAEAGVLVFQDLGDDDFAVFAGVVGDLPGRGLQGLGDDVEADLLVALGLAWPLSTAAIARRNATPPPGTMPSSAAAWVACSASSMRSLRSFISVSVFAPALMTATPPVSFARRSWSFSWS